MKKFLRILYVIIFLIAGTIAFLHPAKTETNILNAIFSKNNADKTIVELSGRYSSKINIIAEASDSAAAIDAAQTFYDSIDKKIFTEKEFDTDRILEKYKKYYNNLLSAGTIKQLKEKNYEAVAAKSLENLYNPLNVMLLPLDEDPFMLFEDYIKSLSHGREDYTSIEYKDKYYSIIQVEVQPDKALSPSVINGGIKKLIKLQKKLSKGEVKIYLTGAPVHSFYASSKSITEMNVIGILSIIFIFALFKLYFSNIKLIVPAAASLGLGFLSGYIASSIIFPSIHVLTFVFSTSLIGICIDYSLHYFIEKDLSKILKSLTISMVTTVSAFAVLLFSGVELLRQISVFTMAGLINVYLIVVLFYPMLKLETAEQQFEIKLPEKSKQILVYSIAALAFCGLFFIKFNDNIKSMYVPSKKLAQAEKLYKEITGTDTETTFAIVRGNDFQNLLEKEEKLTGKLDVEGFQALSKFIPSHKQQLKNQNLRKRLYEHSLKNYASFLNEQQINSLLNENFDENGFLDIEEQEIFSEFLLDKNTSVMVLYNLKNPQAITDSDNEYIDITKNISDKIKHCRKNCLLTLLPVLAVLFALLSSVYKPKTAIKILLPSILAPAFAIGILSIFHSEINIFHIFAIFLIIGFGLDYSVFRAGGIKGSHHAVLLSAATTILSFLMLSLTSFKLISALGTILTLGLIISYLTSLAFDYQSQEPSE